jgi:hypothetical protein
MFDRRLLATGTAILCVAGLAIFLAGRPQEPAVNIGEVPADVRVNPARPPAVGETYAYIMREYNGFIAVFAFGDQEPLTVLDTAVRFLPDYDRRLLEEGIPLRDYADLAARIEDYIS